MAFFLSIHSVHVSNTLVECLYIVQSQNLIFYMSYKRHFSYKQSLNFRYKIQVGSFYIAYFPGNQKVRSKGTENNPISLTETKPLYGRGDKYC